MSTLALREPGALGAPGEIPLCVPYIDGNAWAYVKECLDTGWVSSVGSFVTRFEEAVSRTLGGVHTVATVNGTAALHVALRVAGVEHDDEVLISALSFIAPANAIRYLGAWPVFIDAEPDYWQMDPAAVAAFLRERCRHGPDGLRNLATGRRVRAMLPVHILGHPVDIDPILELAREFQLPVVEDATEGLGAKYKGRAVGTLGDIACLSFNGNKLITTGGGGMVVTRDPVLARRTRYLTTQAKDNAIEFVHGEVGYNYRLSNVLAAIGLAQMERFEEHIASKRQTARRYESAIRGVAGLTAMPEAPWAESVYWLYTMLVDEREFGLDSRGLLQRLADASIQSRPLWQPLCASPAHAGASASSCPVAEQLNARALSLPSSVGLGDEDQRRVIGEILRSRRAG